MARDVSRAASGSDMYEAIDALESEEDEAFSRADSAESDGSPIKFKKKSSRWYELTKTGVIMEEVFEEEKQLIKEKFEEQARDGTVKEVPPGEKFALAFSGGGIRAAAFQAGVLWRLAQMGRLKDVEMLTAVSGGGYIASSYLSHLAHTEEPKEGENLDDWYRKVVAATIVRMQANQGAFVRDLGKGTSGIGGCCTWVPRICDCPALILMILLTMFINPLLFILFSVPLVETIEIFFGSAMRAAFCQNPTSIITDTLIDWSFPWYGTLLYACLALFVLALFFNALSGLQNKYCCKPKVEEGEKYMKAPLTWQIINALTCFLNRFVILAFAMVFFIETVVQLMRYSYMLEEAINPGSNKAGQLCAVYTSSFANSTGPSECASQVNGTYWYERPEFNNVTYKGGLDTQTQTQLYSFLMDMLKAWFDEKAPDLGGLVSFFLLLMLAASSVCLFFLPQLMSITIAILGPAFIFLFLADLTKYRVYGNLTHAHLFGLFSYDQDLWRTFSVSSTFFAIAFIPFYQFLRAVMHNYYRRILMNNYYCDGKDNALTQFQDVLHSPYFLLMGTASDFVRVGDSSPHASTTEISFSPLHMGSEKTGYIQTPEFMVLSKAAALSGAGGMDAIGLGLNDQLAMRFWTEALNLTWGDYVLFQEKSFVCIRKIARCVPSCCEKEFAWLLLRIPSILIWDAMFLVFAYGGYDAARGTGVGEECEKARTCFLTGYIIFWIFSLFSFFWFIPSISMFVSFSPIMRICHQVTRFYYTGNRPPPMLYITDGGAYDCTTLTQLVLRRTRRIFMVLAAMDPNDELGVLKTAMKFCVDEKLCSFYDPKHPDKDYMVYLDSFKQDKSMPYMHIGISYGWGETVERGTLIIVKNRLRPENEQWPIHPWLTEDEILGGEMEACSDDEFGFDFREESWDELYAEDLGGYCCCDSAHLRGCNAGTKWPQLTGANYLWLSPMLFNELCRLGHSESALPAEIITSHDKFYKR